ncbi:unnamed protein product, partial [Rotaria socialis]
MIIQPQTENPPQPKIKEKVLTIKLKGIIQVKRSYEHISSENVTGENIINTTNDKNIKRKTSNNKNFLNTNVYSKDTQLPLETESAFDSESTINNNINDIGLQRLDQPQNFETESCLNQIVVTAEIHNNPDYESILITSNEIYNENPSNTGTDISVAIDSPAIINDLNTVNTVDTLESINLTNNQAPTPDCFRFKRVALVSFSLIDQFSDQIQSGSYVSFNQIYCDVSIIFEGYGHGTNDVMGVNIGSLLNKKSFITSHLNADTNKRDCLFRAIGYVTIRSEKMKNAAKGAEGLNIRAHEIGAKARLLSLKCELPLEIAATPVHLEKIALKLDIRIGCYMVEENTGLIKTFYTNAVTNNKNKTTVLLCLYKNCYYPLLYPRNLILSKNSDCLGKCKFCLSTTCDAPPDNEQNNELDRQNDDEINIALNIPQPSISCDN